MTTARKIQGQIESYKKALELCPQALAINTIIKRLEDQLKALKAS